MGLSPTSVGDMNSLALNAPTVSGLSGAYCSIFCFMLLLLLKLQQDLSLFYTHCWRNVKASYVGSLADAGRAFKIAR